MAIVQRLRRPYLTNLGLDDRPPVVYDDEGNPIIAPESDLVGAPVIHPFTEPVGTEPYAPQVYSADMSGAPSIDGFTPPAPGERPEPEYPPPTPEVTPPVLPPTDGPSGGAQPYNRYAGLYAPESPDPTKSRMPIPAYSGVEEDVNAALEAQNAYLRRQRPPAPTGTQITPPAPGERPDPDEMLGAPFRLRPTDNAGRRLTGIGEIGHAFAPAPIARGGDMLQLIGGSFSEAVGEAVGMPALTQEGRLTRQKMLSQLASGPQRRRLEEVQSWDDFKGWVVDFAGEQLPLMIPSMAVGFLAGGPIGAYLGAFAPSYVMEMGQIQAEMKGKNPDAVLPAEAWLMGGAAAVLDAALPGKFGSTLRRVLGREAGEEAAKRLLLMPAQGVIQRGARGAVTGVATEGFTEAMQEAIEETAASRAAGTPIDVEALKSAALEAGVGGGLMGGGIGAITGVAEGGRGVGQELRDVGAGAASLAERTLRAAENVPLGLSVESRPEPVPVGKNALGYDLYANEHGTRSYTDSRGVRHGELQMTSIIPGVGAGETRRAGNDEHFSTVEELEPERVQYLAEREAFVQENYDRGLQKVIATDLLGAENRIRETEANLRKTLGPRVRKREEASLAELRQRAGVLRSGRHPNTGVGETVMLNLEYEFEDVRRERDRASFPLGTLVEYEGKRYEVAYVGGSRAELAVPGSGGYRPLPAAVPLSLLKKVETSPVVTTWRTDPSSDETRMRPALPGSLPSNLVSQNPTGTWSVVGRVSPDLAYINEDGSPPTPAQLATIQQSGPGFTRPRIRTRSWPTREEAEAAVAAFMGRSSAIIEGTQEEATSGDADAALQRPGVEGQGAQLPAGEPAEGPAAAPSAGTARAGIVGTGGGVQEVRQEPGAVRGTADGGVAPGGPTVPAGERERLTPASRTQDYRMDPADIEQSATATPVTRFNRNLEALRVLNLIESEGRTATEEEQDIIAGYSGFGDSAFNEGFSTYPRDESWKRRGDALRAMLSTEDYQALEKSRVNAFYTTPTVVNAMWDGLARLGAAKLPNIRVLEPSAGSGRFLGLQPAEMQSRSQRTAVDLDVMTGRVLKALFPNTEVYGGVGFERAPIADSSIDLAISNVPFGDIPVTDPAFLKGTRREMSRSIHNYFFAKTLDKLRPGGVMAYVTSHYTMDAPSAKNVRSYIAEQADLLGAIRLPEGAFPDTQVVTDIIFLQKRAPGQTPNGIAWENTQQTDPMSYTEKLYGSTYTRTAQHYVNEYFFAHPEMVLGTHAATGTMNRAGSYNVEPDDRDLTVALAQAMQNLPADVLKPAAADAGPRSGPRQNATAGLAQFAYVIRENGDLAVHLGDGRLVRNTDLTAAEETAVKQMLGIRDAARAVLDAQSNGREADHVKGLQKTLTTLYDAFKKSRGALNDSKNMGLMLRDPDGPFLRALEVPESQKGQFRKADLFSKTVVRAMPETRATTAQDAMLVVLNRSGRLDFDEMGSVLGRPGDAVRAELAAEGRIFKNPTGDWEHADQYLTGNVRSKLAAAELAAQANPSFAPNVEALRAVQPEDIPYSKISVKLGVPWIPASDIDAFIAQLLNARRPYDRRGHSTHFFERVEQTGDWVSVARVDAGQSEVYYRWGHVRMGAPAIIERMLNDRPLTVSPRKQGNNEPDAAEILAAREATAQVQEKARGIQEAFRNWLWQDGARAERLSRAYNDSYNDTRARIVDGSHLTLPGMATQWSSGKPLEMRAHQKDAIWRIVLDGVALLAHEVGFGKTAVMVGASMELRRLGLSRKNLVVVPKATHQQFSEQFRELYPAAKVLSPMEGEFTDSNRTAFVARIATGDWDAVVLTKEQFYKIPTKPETQEAFLRQQIQEARVAESMAEGNSHKDIQKKLLRLEADLQELQLKIQKAADRTTVFFEDLGIDYLMVDEADNYKNLPFTTHMGRVKGLPQSEALVASDMFMKTRYLQQRNNGRGVIFSTGTPIANTLAEQFTMMRYLQNPLLEERQIQFFDAWAKVFASVEDEVERTTQGTYRMTARLRQLDNAPELSNLWQQVADLRVADEVPEMRKVQPRIVDEKGIAGKRITVVAEPDQALQDYMQTIVARAETMSKADPREDNMLKLSSDARMASLDVRMVDPAAPENPRGKVAMAAEKIAGIYRETTKDKGTQLVFLDMGTPKAQKDTKATDTHPDAQVDEDVEETAEELQKLRNVYATLRQRLERLGVPAKEIAFIHDAKNNNQRQALFRKVNSGEIRVLIGSTGKLGVGVNVQERAAALHHLDAPWRPRDIEQREGRIVRQGNVVYGPRFKPDGGVADEGPGVRIFNYVMEDSFDAFMWQAIEAKAVPIKAFMRRTVTEREIANIDELVISASTAKALASGNPNALKLVTLQTDMSRLQITYAAHQDSVIRARGQLSSLPVIIARSKERLAYLKKDAVVAQAILDSKSFSMFAGGRQHKERKDAAEALREGLRSMPVDTSLTNQAELGRFGGFVVSAFWTTTSGDTAAYALVLRNPETNMGHGATYIPITQLDSADPVARLENVVRELPYDREREQETLERHERSVASYSELIDKPFAQAARLQAMQAEIARLLRVMQAPKPEDVAPEDLVAGEIPSASESDALSQQAPAPAPAPAAPMAPIDLGGGATAEVRNIGTSPEGGVTGFEITPPPAQVTVPERQTDIPPAPSGRRPNAADISGALAESQAEIPAAPTVTESDGYTVGDVVQHEKFADGQPLTVTDVTDPDFLAVETLDGTTTRIRKRAPGLEKVTAATEAPAIAGVEEPVVPEELPPTPEPEPPTIGEEQPDGTIAGAKPLGQRPRTAKPGQRAPTPPAPATTGTPWPAAGSPPVDMADIWASGTAQGQQPTTEPDTAIAVGDYVLNERRDLAEVIEVSGDSLILDEPKPGQWGQQRRTVSRSSVTKPPRSMPPAPPSPTAGEPSGGTPDYAAMLAAQGQQPPPGAPGGPAQPVQMVPEYWARPLDNADMVAGAFKDNFWRDKFKARGLRRLTSLVNPAVLVDGRGTEPVMVAKRAALLRNRVLDVGESAVQSALSHLRQRPVPFTFDGNGVVVDVPGGAKLHWGDLFELKPYEPGYRGPHRFTPEQTEYIKLYHDLFDDGRFMLTENGIAPRTLDLGPERHWIMRVVTAVREVQNERSSQAGGRIGARASYRKTRIHEFVEDGLANGVEYSPDPAGVMHLYGQWLYKEIADQRLADEVNPLGQTASQRVSGPARQRLEDATSRFERAKKLLDGVNRSYRVERLSPGFIQSIAADFPAEADLLRQAGPDNPQLYDIELHARTLMRGARDDFHNAKGAFRVAKERASTPRLDEAHIPQPFANGRIFPREVADEVNRVYGDQANELLRQYNAVQGFSRTAMVGLDFGAPFIQLLPVLYRHPYLWAKASVSQYAALLKPELRQQWLVDNAAVMREASQYGVLFARPEFFEGLDTGSRVVKAVPTETGRQVVSWLGRQTFGRFGEAMGTTMDVAAIEMWKAHRERALREGPDSLYAVADFVNHIRGTMSQRAIGVSEGRQAVEQGFGPFAVRYTKAGFALIGDAAQGGYKGHEARRALVSLAAGGFMTFAAAAAWYMASGDMDEEELWDRLTPIKNGRYNSKFMTLPVGTDNVGFGSFYYSLLRLIAGTIDKLLNEPEDLMKLDARDNPLIQFAQTRIVGGAPGVSLALELFTGVNAIGQKLTTNTDYATAVAKRFTPLWFDAYILEDPSASLEAAPAMSHGLRVFPESYSSQRKTELESLAEQERGELLPRKEGEPTFPLRKGERDALNVKYPQLAELQEKADKQSDKWVKSPEQEQTDKIFAGLDRLKAERQSASVDFYRSSPYLGNMISGAEFLKQRKEVTSTFSDGMSTLKGEYPKALMDRAQREAYYRDNRIDLPDAHPDDIAAEGYYNITVPDDLFGRPDWEAFFTEREKFLGQYSQDVQDYILGKGKYSEGKGYSSKRFTEKWMNDIEVKVQKDLELVGQYYDVADEVDAVMPAHRAIKREWDRYRQAGDRDGMAEVEKSLQWKNRKEDISTTREALRRRRGDVQEAGDRLDIFGQVHYQTVGEMQEKISRRIIFQGQPVPYGALNTNSKEDINAYIELLNMTAQEIYGREYTQLPVTSPAAAEVVRRVGAIHFRSKPALKSTPYVPPRPSPTAVPVPSLQSPAVPAMVGAPQLAGVP